MRYTKERVNNLVMMLEHFQRMPFKTVGPAREEQIRNLPGFIPAGQYAFGYAVMPGEIGRTVSCRWKYKSRKGER